MSSPSRIITATDASSSSARTVVTGTGPTPAISHRSPGSDVPTREGGSVDDRADLHGFAWPFAGQRNERVGGVGGPGLAASGPAGVLEDPLEVPPPSRTETRTGIRREACFQAIGAVRIGPLVRSPLDVQTPRPRGVICLRTRAHLAAAVAQALHAGPGCGLQQGRLGGGIGAGGARDLSGLCRREITGTERGVGPRQVFEGTRRLQRSAGGADRLARCLGDPVRGAAMPALAPGVRLLDAHARRAP